MKGAITCALAEMVTTHYGEQSWSSVLARADVGNQQGLRIPLADVEDSMVFEIIAAACQVLQRTCLQLADEFGEYWCCVYAPRVYHAYIKRFRNAREMILGMDHVHMSVTRGIKNARPPRFEYQEAEDGSLTVLYRSHRDMLDLYIGLVRGVGKYFNEPVIAEKLSPIKCRIAFSGIKTSKGVHHG